MGIEDIFCKENTILPLDLLNNHPINWNHNWLTKKWKIITKTKIDLKKYWKRRVITWEEMCQKIRYDIELTCGVKVFEEEWLMESQKVSYKWYGREDNILTKIK